jgi:hypothetical protein
LIFPIPTFVNKQTTTEAPTPTNSMATTNQYKEAELKTINEKINGINQTIASWQANIESYKSQEHAQWNAPNPTLSDGSLSDLADTTQYNAYCSQSYYSLIADAQNNINSLIRKRNDLEWQKKLILVQ